MPRTLYPALVHTDDGRVYGATIIDLHINAQGPTPEAALREAEEIAAEAIADLLADGPLPEPTPIASIPPEDRADCVAVSLVPVLVPGRAKRVQVTLDEDLLARIDEATNNRSGFLAEAARARLAE